MTFVIALTFQSNATRQVQLRSSSRVSWNAIIHTLWLQPCGPSVPLRDASRALPHALYCGPPELPSHDVTFPTQHLRDFCRRPWMCQDGTAFLQITFKML